MALDKREIITKEKLAPRILRKMRVWFLMFIPFFASMCLLLFLLLSYLLRADLVALIFYVPILVSVVLPGICVLVIAIQQYRRVKSLTFLLVEDVLSDPSEFNPKARLMPRKLRRFYYKGFNRYFSRYGLLPNDVKVPLRSVQGDRFILAVLEGKRRDRILACFSVNSYRADRLDTSIYDEKKAKIQKLVL